MRVARALAFRLALILSTVVAGLAIGPLLPLLPPRRVRQIIAVWERYLQLLLRYLVGLRLHWEGSPPPGPVVFAAKHESALETLAFHARIADLAVLVKQELARIPIFGWYLLAGGNIPVDRSGGASALKALIRSSEAALDQGLNILIFPEGTRVEPGEERPLQPGVAALYSQLNVAVVPVVVDTGRFWGRGFVNLHPGDARIRFLEPIAPGQNRRAFMATLRERLQPSSLTQDRLILSHEESVSGFVAEAASSSG